MQYTRNKIFYRFSLLFFILAITFQSCIETYLLLRENVRNEFIIENDQVHSLKRIKCKFHYKAQEERTPLYRINQTVLKEITADKKDSYKVYDVLTMSCNSFALENKVYLIINDDVLPINIDYKEIEVNTDISEDSKDLLTADSTRVSVVTGYSQNQTKIIKIRYVLSSNIIDKIKKSELLIFRYYAGPDMITALLSSSDLNRFKTLIGM